MDKKRSLILIFSAFVICISAFFLVSRTNICGLLRYCVYTCKEYKQQQVNGDILPPKCDDISFFDFYISERPLNTGSGNLIEKKGTVFTKDGVYENGILVKPKLKQDSAGEQNE